MWLPISITAEHQDLWCIYFPSTYGKCESSFYDHREQKHREGEICLRSKKEFVAKQELEV